VWVFVGSLNITSTQPVNLTVPLVIEGKLRIENSNSTLVIAESGVPELNISGTADLHGSLIVIVNNSVPFQAGQQITIGFAANLTHSFDSVELQSINGCIRYTTSSIEYSHVDSSLSVLIESAASTCGSGGVQWWVYLIAIIGAVLLVVALIALGIWVYRKGLCRDLFRKRRAHRSRLGITEP